MVHLIPVCSDGAIRAMPQSNDFRVRVRLGRGTWWSILLGLALALAIGIAIAVVAVGVFVILVPVLAVGAAVYYLYRRARFHPPRYQHAKDTVIIDGKFRVIEPGEKPSDDPTGAK
jgi:hypothetical protein